MIFDCDNNVISFEDIVRTIFFNGTDAVFEDCDNQNLSLEDVFKNCIVVGTDGLPAIRVSGVYIYVTPTLTLTSFDENDYQSYLDRVAAAGGTVLNTSDVYAIMSFLGASDTRTFTFTGTCGDDRNFSIYKYNGSWSLAGTWTSDYVNAGGVMTITDDTMVSQYKFKAYSWNAISEDVYTPEIIYDVFWSDAFTWDDALTWIG